MFRILLPVLVLGAAYLHLTSAALPTRLKRDGVGDIWGFPGVSYKAVDYVPVCGTLSLTKPEMYNYIQTVATCEPSMLAYNKTSAPSTVYDLTGVSTDVQVGSGTQVCMCFSLGGPPGKMDFCMNVLEDGTPEGRWSLRWDDIAGGTFNSNSIKALPQCSDVDVAAISSSVYASIGGSGSSATPKPVASQITVVTTSGTQVQTYITAVPVPTSGNAQAADSGGLTRSDQIALGVGIGMGLPAIILAALALYFRVRPKKVQCPTCGRTTSSQNLPVSSPSHTTTRMRYR